ncbi:MAG: hypothetical protein QOJ40_588 [Verrucomicrobiota bacterium]
MVDPGGKTDSAAIFWRLGRREQALEAEKRILQFEDQLFTFVLFALVDPLDLGRQRLNALSKPFDTGPQFLEVVPVSLRFLRQKQELVDVLKKLLQHGR